MLQSQSQSLVDCIASEYTTRMTRPTLKTCFGEVQVSDSLKRDVVARAISSHPHPIDLSTMTTRVKGKTLVIDFPFIQEIQCAMCPERFPLHNMYVIRYKKYHRNKHSDVKTETLHAMHAGIICDYCANRMPYCDPINERANVWPYVCKFMSVGHKLRLSIHDLCDSAHVLKETLNKPKGGRKLY